MILVRKNVYKDVCLLKSFQCFLEVVLKVFLKVLWSVVLKNGKDCFARFGQVTKSYLP